MCGLTGAWAWGGQWSGEIVLCCFEAEGWLPASELTVALEHGGDKDERAFLVRLPFSLPAE